MHIRGKFNFFGKVQVASRRRDFSVQFFPLYEACPACSIEDVQAPNQTLEKPRRNDTPQRTISPGQPSRQLDECA
tara:strand:+ start:427 stop:651 length:225 start_codon:yes stop_codon:yes gene_type:complete